MDVIVCGSRVCCLVCCSVWFAGQLVAVHLCECSNVHVYTSLNETEVSNTVWQLQLWLTKSSATAQRSSISVSSLCICKPMHEADLSFKSKDNHLHGNSKL